MLFIPLFSLPLYSAADDMQRMQQHQRELKHQRADLDKDLKSTRKSMEALEPIYQNIKTQFADLKSRIQSAKAQIEKDSQAQTQLQEELQKLTPQLVGAKKKIYLKRKFQKRLPPFLSHEEPEEAIQKGIVRLESRERWLTQHIQTLQQETHLRHQEIQDLQKKKAALKPDLKQRQAQYETARQAYQDLDEQQKDYTDQIKAMKDQQSSYEQSLPDRAGLFDKPVLIQPVSGEVTYLREAEGEFRPGGAIIDAQVSQEVVSPGNGKVSFQGTMAGFGEVVVLEHGGQWTSMVAGIWPEVTQGQTIKRGQKIGKVAQDLKGRVYVELLKEGRPRVVTFP